MLPDLQRLIELQDIESRAAVANKAIAEAPGRIAALDALLQSSTATLAAAKQALADNQTHRRSIDKDLISAQQRQEKYKEQLMAVKTNDEYRAMQHQIEAVGVEVGQHEERVLVNMMEADDINAAIKKAEAALKAAQLKVAQERAAIENEVKMYQATLAECTATRDKVIAALEQSLGLRDGTLDHERAVLRDYGNMSAPTVLFVLERLLATEGMPRNSMLLALGPGFTSSGLLLSRPA